MNVVSMQYKQEITHVLIPLRISVNKMKPGPWSVCNTRRECSIWKQIKSI